MCALILVEPEGGLPEVDHEFYIVQGELFTTGALVLHVSGEPDPTVFAPQNAASAE